MKRTRSQTKANSNPDDSQSPSSIKSTTATPSTKISFRARKIPRLNRDTDTVDNKETKASASTHSLFSPMIAKPLTCKGEIEVALNHLRNADHLLATCIDTFRPPHFFTDRAPFVSLTKSIISQQLSNKASDAIETRFVSLCGGLSAVLPDVVLALSPQQLRQVGISGPKATYLHDLSTKFADGVLSDSSILEMDDETLHNKLTMVKGIGPWSVHMFMIFTLHRPDVLPVGDLVVRRGVERLYGLKGLPLPSEMEHLCQKWKPYRSVGSWYMYRLVEAKGVLPRPTPPVL
ncbi:alkylbase DNA glycosidase-like protein mag2 [Gastrolobium bilobum]|uniref:alkylbase DNA glycosidase-like protein mag2 n=1 Tax=Gastrolobium bilobum TaxID=150636 RepID=UPI002AB1B1CF|nr:alkylbase DNA glycosidase-like protein mag2 [Gastrolobium bilobum]